MRLVSEYTLVTATVSGGHARYLHSPAQIDCQKFSRVSQLPGNLHDSPVTAIDSYSSILYLCNLVIKVVYCDVKRRGKALLSTSSGMVKYLELCTILEPLKTGKEYR